MASEETANKLLRGILTGVAAGAVLGGFYPQGGLAVKFIGDLFMRALLLVAVPLVATSMIAGVSGLGDVRKLGGLAVWTITYFLATTLIAVVLGIVLSLSFRPGYATSGGVGPIQSRAQQTAKGPDRPVPDRATTDNAVPGRTIEKTSPGQTLIDVTYQLVPKNIFGSLAKGEVVPVIVFALIFGCVLTTLGSQGQVVIAFFQGVNQAVMKMVHLLMLAAPVGIGALIAARLGAAGGFGGFQQEMVQLGMYVMTVLTGLAIHGGIILPIIFVLWCHPAFRLLGFVSGMVPALATAFSTASSSAALPAALDCVIGNRVSPKVANFVMPLGTINQNGTALYEAVAVLFIAQLYGVHLSLLQLFAVVITATLAAVGAAGIPEAGMVTMALVLNAVHLPLEGISLLLVVDWFLDRCRTAVNVWTDSVGAAIMDVLERRGKAALPAGQSPGRPLPVAHH